jgi:hypothetical protein
MLVLSCWALVNGQQVPTEDGPPNGAGPSERSPAASFVAAGDLMATTAVR